MNEQNAPFLKRFRLVLARKRRVQCFLLDDGSSRGIDEIRGWLHLVNDQSGIRAAARSARTAMARSFQCSA